MGFHFVFLNLAALSPLSVFPYMEFGDMFLLEFTSKGISLCLGRSVHFYKVSPRTHFPVCPRHWVSESNPAPSEVWRTL